MCRCNLLTLATARATEHKLLSVADYGHFHFVSSFLLGGGFRAKVGLAKLVLAIAVRFDVEFKEQAFAAVLAVENLDAAFWNADSDVWLSVFSCDFLRALQFK